MPVSDSRPTVIDLFKCATMTTTIQRYSSWSYSCSIVKQIYYIILSYKINTIIYSRRRVPIYTVQC